MSQRSSSITGCSPSRRRSRSGWSGSSACVPPCRDPPGWVLDIGSGTGRDAAALAAMGHRVIAAEPTDEIRVRAAALHPSPQIEWLDDSLPDLRHALGLGRQFDVVMMTAVLMHLDEPQ